MTVPPIPEGYHAITPYFHADDPAGLLDFVVRAFDAEVVERLEGPGGVVLHAEARIGDSILMLGLAREGYPAMPLSIYLYVPDVDATYARTLELGATSIDAPTDQFYGDRSGGVQDPFGNVWWLATHVEDMSPEEIQKRMEAMGERE